MKNIFTLISIAAISLSSVVTNAEVIQVGTRSDGAPYVQIDEQGLPSGFDMDILHAIAEDQSLELNIRITEFGNLLPGLDSGEFDLVMGGITMTDERQAQYDFSQPYIQDYVGALAKDSSLDISSIEALANTRLALERNSIFHRNFSKIGVEPILVESVFLGIKAVAQGKADMFISDEFIIAHAIKSHSDINFTLRRLSTNGLLPENIIGIAVKKGNTELLNKINQGIEKN